MKKDNGITLIALVITIVVMIILAGVAINLTLGENGVFRKAKFAKEEYNNAQIDEQTMLNELATFGIDGSNLEENTPTTDAGTLVKLPDSWSSDTMRYVNTADGKEVTNVEKVATVYAISVGNGDTVPIPYGFYYVGGTLNSGVVISDNVEDKDTYKGQEDVPSGIVLNDDGTTISYVLKGNLFVWIPVSINSYNKYDWGTTYRNNIYVIDTPVGEKVQIQKYGGLYVGRYEAGLASTITETTSTQKNTGTNGTYNLAGIPQSKAGLIPWNFVSYTQATQNAQNMYSNNYVTSGLITGTQWDAMISWMTGASNSNELTSNCNWGNYIDTTPAYIGRTAYVYVSSGYWYQNKFTDTFTSGTKPAGTVNTSNNGKATLLTTGASEQDKKKNIYDVAGNLWEWVEETAVATTSNGVLINNKVLRGGSFGDAYASRPACYRNYNTASSTNTTYGFRPVLYIK